jgi:hypothetical protein
MALEKNPATSRIDFHDTLVPGLSLRMSERGHLSWVLLARYPLKPKNPTRRALGDLNALKLDQARSKARAWIQLIDRSIDPNVEEERQRALELRRQRHSFATVAHAFKQRYVKGRSTVELERIAAALKEREPSLTEAGALAAVHSDPKNAKLVARSLLGPKEGEGIANKTDAVRTLEAEFLSRWADRPAAEITQEEVAAAIRAIVDRGAPYQAHNAIALVRRLYT